MVLEPADDQSAVAAGLFVKGGGFKKSCNFVNRKGDLVSSLVLGTPQEYGREIPFPQDLRRIFAPEEFEVDLVEPVALGEDLRVGSVSEADMKLDGHDPPSGANLDVQERIGHGDALFTLFG